MLLLVCHRRCRTSLPCGWGCKKAASSLAIACTAIMLISGLKPARQIHALWVDSIYRTVQAQHARASQPQACQSLTSSGKHWPERVPVYGACPSLVSRLPG